MQAAAQKILATTVAHWESEMSLTLSPEEVRELTHRVRPSKQIEALRAMGIEHKVRPDGSVAVLRSHVDAQMGAPKERRQTEWQPNWSAA